MTGIMTQESDRYGRNAIMPENEDSGAAWRIAQESRVIGDTQSDR